MKRVILTISGVWLVASVTLAQNTTRTTPPASRYYAGDYRTLRGFPGDGASEDGPNAPKLLANWKRAKDASEREKIEKSLRDSLTQEFEARMAAHEQEVKELETKVRQLHERLALRKEKQKEIVEHRFEQLLRDAQGLGWGADEPSDGTPTLFVRRAPSTEAYVPLQIAPPAAAEPARVEQPASSATNAPK